MNVDQTQRGIFIKQNLEICLLAIILMLFLAMISRSNLINGPTGSIENNDEVHSFVSVMDDTENTSAELRSPEIGQ